MKPVTRKATLCMPLALRALKQSGAVAEMGCAAFNSAMLPDIVLLEA